MKQIKNIYLFVFALSFFLFMNIDDVKANYEIMVNGTTPCKLYNDLTGKKATGSCIYKDGDFDSYVSGPVWVDNGDKVTVITTSATIPAPESGYGSECKSDFNRIKIDYNNKSYYGYVCGDLLKKVEITEEMKQEFQTAGFPESYWDELAVLKTAHPSWKFVAIDTGITFDKAVKGEDSGSKSLIQVTTSAKQGYLSTKESNYDWDKDEFTVYDGSNWYAANADTIAYYLDPRNFLSDTFIFQFESIVYDKNVHTLDGVQALLKDAYILKFANYFMEAATTHQVNPLYLAALSRQEVGTTKSTAISGNKFTYNGKSYSNLYNFYNIGATAGTNAVYRGLVFAGTVPSNKSTRYGRIWNTEQKAIIGGAEFIKKSYMDYGQNTSYFKKWNVIAEYQKAQGKDYYNNFTHQYMQNIGAPSAEARKTYQSYAALGALDLNFVFYIPVYKEMADSYDLPAQGNPNNRLKNIKIDNQLIDGFTSSEFSYTVYVEGNVETVNITAGTVNANATVKGTGTKEIEVGENKFELIVEAQNGNIQKYDLIIHRALPDTGEIVYPPVEEILTNAKVTYDDKYISNLTFTSKTVDFKNAILAASDTAQVEIKSGNTEKKDGYLATGDTVTITSGEETKTYSIVLYGDINGDGKINAIDLLKIQKHILKDSLLSGAQLESSDVNKDGVINAVDLLKIQKHILGDSFVSQQ